MKSSRTPLMVPVSLALTLAAGQARAQVYGYTNDKGVLILSNVPTDPRMRLIAEGSPEPAGRIWRYSGQYDSLIFQEANRNGLDSALVKAVIAVESGFNRFARSGKGAMGLMQLMPDTCRRYRVSNPYDAPQNVRAGSRHLRDLLDEFRDLDLTLAAYNAGATPVRKLGRVPPYRETLDYIRKVSAIYKAGSKITISKGGKIYTMGPGGKTEVRPSGAATPAFAKTPPPSDPGAVAARTTVGVAAVSETAATASASLEPSSNPPPSAESMDELLYYRYTDSSGIVYITREKPSHASYEVLRP